jgi:hypothetical protein
MDRVTLNRQWVIETRSAVSRKTVPRLTLGSAVNPVEG